MTVLFFDEVRHGRLGFRQETVKPNLVGEGI